MRVAAHLDIPFLTFDAADVYKREVADYFIRTYEAGLTPNPDVLCNQHVKFGAFLDFAVANGASHVATGHYARRKEVETKDAGQRYQLWRGVDASKDQSYFLWTLTSAQLAQVLLPVGDSRKVVIRAEAARAGLPTAEKRDSQGICFLGQIDIKEFLSHYLTLTPGPVLDTAGTVVGKHDGALIYTLGQRHGFRITTAHSHTLPHYVVNKDVKQNTITVATTPPETSANERVTLSHCNFINEMPAADSAHSVQFRYRQTPVPITIREATQTKAKLQLANSTETPAAGQSAVLYDGARCLGGGVVSL
jgi:tRNA-specific 2-thiouridylase